MNGSLPELVIKEITAKLVSLGGYFFHIEILTLALQQGDQSNNEHSKSQKLR